MPLNATGTITNTADVTSATFDYQLVNNATSYSADVAVADLSTSSISVTDVNGGDARPGDILRYEVTITETANARLSGVSLASTIDALLANLLVTNSGGVDASSGSDLDVTDISLAPGGTVTVVFEALIRTSALDGDVIANTTTLNNPANGTTINLVAPNVVVGASGLPSSGIKPLYLGDFAGSQTSPVLPMPMSRLPLSAVAAPERVRIRVQDNNRYWHMQPPLAAPLELDTDPIPVLLHMRRSGNPSARTVRVAVDYLGASSGFLGCQVRTLAGSGATGLSDSVTRAFTFNVERTDANCNPIPGAPVTLSPGTVVRLHVDNGPGTPGGGQPIFVYPYSDATPDTSRLELPANTVINVDSTTIYDAPYPAGATPAGHNPGDTVYVRAVVSDPFGSFDITSADIEILDPSAAPVLTSAMTEVASDAATKTFELAYSLPAGAANGTWTARVTAREGTEGTIAHLGVTTFVVGSGASITLTKSVVSVRDPITGTNNPKSIPGAVMEYTITATNTGPLPVDANTVRISEQLPADVLLVFGAPPNPISFAQGAVSSGLSYSFVSLSDPTDDVAFSNDGGATFVTPVVDPITGVDLTSPPINYLQITPTGQFAAPSGGADPSFSITLQVQIR